MKGTTGKVFLSISIPIYNAEAYLDESISSIMRQHFDDFELILVDDGSTDRSVSICEKWIAKHPDTIRLIKKENSGSLFTRRRCLQESLGEYIYIMDADDYLIDDNMIVKIKFLIDQTGADFIFFNSTSDSSSCSTYFHYPYHNGQIFEGSDLGKIYELVISSQSFNPLWNKVFSRTLVDWGNDYSHYDYVTNGTDFFQLLPILSAAKRIVYLDEIMHYYRSTPGSIIHKFTPTVYDSLRENHLRLCGFAKTWCLVCQDMDRLLAQRFMHSVSTAVYKARLINADERIRRIDFIRSVGEDSAFRMNYTNKVGTLIRRIIVFLLYYRKYWLLSFLFGVISKLMKSR
jgi:glycosyltransferase involved in cell wall biosynthesis